LKKANKSKSKNNISASSRKWLGRNAKDPYTKLANQNNLRSRAAYKLANIDEKFKLFKNAKVILDLGSAPGSWLQYIKTVTKHDCKLVGVDIKLMEKIDGVKMITGDFTDQDVQEELRDILGENLKSCDVICSDMAPYASGNRSINHINIMNLAESVLTFSESFLNQQGHLIIKLFEGNRTKLFFNKLKKQFQMVKFFKPDASYSDSSEIFIIAENKL
jgi:23S rRNA (uridine2552-2'-O)-methyltransferase